MQPAGARRSSPRRAKPLAGWKMYGLHFEIAEFAAQESIVASRVEDFTITYTPSLRH